MQIKLTIMLKYRPAVDRVLTAMTFPTSSWEGDRREQGQFESPEDDAGETSTHQHDRSHREPEPVLSLVREVAIQKDDDDGEDVRRGGEAVGRRLIVLREEKSCQPKTQTKQ